MTAVFNLKFRFPIATNPQSDCGFPRIVDSAF
jgi:hypothetical protein